MVIPYPALERHGIIGDRRTAALVAADGTLDFLCLPDYDGPLVFATLLDWARGGYWRLGPNLRAQGEQSYLTDSMVLETKWNLDEGTLVLRDAMLWPETGRAPEQQQVRTIIRCLRCEEGRCNGRLEIRPAIQFEEPSTSWSAHASGFSLTLPELSLRLWASAPLEQKATSLEGHFELKKDHELWTVLEVGAAGHGWSAEAARNGMEQARQYWSDWLAGLSLKELNQPEVRRTALMVHLLSYAPEGSVVAAPTTSLPERIGGDWNADYRLSWVRDTSLALGILAKMGDWQETEQFLQWICKRQSRFGHPLQVLYDIRGTKRPRQREIKRAEGYRASRPVRAGNHAYKQQQLGSLGFLADCTWAYVQEGGEWREEYWRLIRRCADYVAQHWSGPDNGIWELSQPQQFVHTKVLCWATLDRAIKIAARVNASFETTVWQTEQAKIHQQVMEKGWSDSLGAFRQSYDNEALDAAELLIPLMDFLPPDHPRVLATIERIAESLTSDGLVYRFNPLKTVGVDKIPMGQMEAAFLPCTFWLATAYAKAGRLDKARGILRNVEKLVGSQGLFPEAIDPRDDTFKGNTPLLFSHVEYARAKLALALAEHQSEFLHQAA